MSVRLWSSEAWREQAVGWIDRAPAGGGDEGALARVGDLRDDELTSLLLT